MSENLLNIKGLAVQFNTTQGVYRALRDVSFSMGSKETLGIVGESGSGKSVTALSIMGLIPDPPGKTTAGEIIFQDRDLLKLKQSEMQSLRGNQIAMIFQEPMTSLNPVHTCGKQIQEPLMIHKNYSKKDARDSAIEYLKLVGIPSPERRFDEYPHQMSGGMRQRVMIAMALVCRPKLLLADEPTTALDVTIQAQILELLKELREKIDAGIIMITHDLGIIADICDRVMVMYAGQVVEISPLCDVFREPLHPYTQGLLSSIPKITDGKKRLFSIDGTVPNPFEMPSGCTFQPRCKCQLPICGDKAPNMFSLGSGRQVRCWRYVDTGVVSGDPGRER